MRMDQHARTKLAGDDFEPLVNIDAELPLAGITPGLWQLLRRMEPFGVENPEPVFSASGVRLMAVPKAVGETHVRLKLGPGGNSASDWRRAITYNAMAWRLAERMQAEKLLPGDLMDIAFALSQNEHPDFGGLELTVRDFKSEKQANAAGTLA